MSVAGEVESPSGFFPLPGKQVSFPKLIQGTYSGPRRRTGYETTRIYWSSTPEKKHRRIM
jgi:hypothetical protein